MIFLKVAWLDGSDADYYKFDSLENAVKYIQEETIIDWILSDVVIDNVPENDYLEIKD